MNKTEIGNRLRELREKRGQSKRFVARQLGISYSALCSYEYGERIPGDEVKIKLSGFYGVPIEQLFYR